MHSSNTVDSENTAHSPDLVDGSYKVTHFADVTAHFGDNF